MHKNCNTNISGHNGKQKGRQSGVHRTAFIHSDWDGDADVMGDRVGEAEGDGDSDPEAEGDGVADADSEAEQG